MKRRFHQPDHSARILAGLTHLLDSDLLLDCSIICEGQVIRAHKVVLSAASEYFRVAFTSLCPANAINSCQNTGIIMKDMPFDDLKILIDFIYTGDVSLDPERIPSVVKSAESLQIHAFLSQVRKIEEDLKVLEVNVKTRETLLKPSSTPTQVKPSGLTPRTPTPVKQKFSVQESFASSPIICQALTAGMGSQQQIKLQQQTPQKQQEITPGVIQNHPTETSLQQHVPIQSFSPLSRSHYKSPRTMIASYVDVDTESYLRRLSPTLTLQYLQNRNGSPNPRKRRVQDDVSNDYSDSHSSGPSRRTSDTSQEKNQLSHEQIRDDNSPSPPRSLRYPFKPRDFFANGTKSLYGSDSPVLRRGPDPHRGANNERISSNDRMSIDSRRASASPSSLRSLNNEGSNSIFSESYDYSSYERGLMKELRTAAANSPPSTSSGRGIIVNNNAFPSNISPHNKLHRRVMEGIVSLCPSVNDPLVSCSKSFRTDDVDDVSHVVRSNSLSSSEANIATGVGILHSCFKRGRGRPPRHSVDDDFNSVARIPNAVNSPVERDCIDNLQNDNNDILVNRKRDDTIFALSDPTDMMIKRIRVSSDGSTASIRGRRPKLISSREVHGKNKCPHCPQVYYSTQAMNDHINNVHSKNATKYNCKHCSKEFSWKISLNKHLRKQHGQNTDSSSLSRVMPSPPPLTFANNSNTTRNSPSDTSPVSIHPALLQVPSSL